MPFAISGILWACTEKKQCLFILECNCNGHSDQCHFDEAVYEESGQVSGGVCDDCQHNTTGINCHVCLPGYEKDPSLPLNHPEICKQGYV